MNFIVSIKVAGFFSVGVIPTFWVSSSTSNVQTVQVIHAPQMDLGCRKAFNFGLVSPILASNLLFSDKSLKHLLTHTLSLTFRAYLLWCANCFVYTFAHASSGAQEDGARVQTASIEEGDRRGRRGYAIG